MSISTKKQANNRLKYAIRAIQGKEFISRKETLLEYCITVKADLKKSGFPWQAWILDTWIHRLQGGEFTARRADPRESEGRSSP